MKLPSNGASSAGDTKLRISSHPMKSERVWNCKLRVKESREVRS